MNFSWHWPRCSQAIEDQWTNSTATWASLTTVLAGIPGRECSDYELYPQMPALTYANSGFSMIWVITPGLLSSPPAATGPSFPAAALPILIARLPLQDLVSQQLQGTFYSLQSKIFMFNYCSRNINSSGLRAALHRTQPQHHLCMELWNMTPI